MPAAADRRRAPRIALLGELHGRLVALDVPVEVLNLSVGGLLLRTPFRIAVGAVHDFNLTLGDESSVVLRGRAKHCHEAQGPDGSPTYEVGFAFIDDDSPADGREVGRIIEKLA